MNDGGSVVVNSPDNSDMILLLQQQNQILMQLLQKIVTYTWTQIRSEV